MTSVDSFSVNRASKSTEVASLSCAMDADPDSDSCSTSPLNWISVIDDIWPNGKSQGMGLKCDDEASG
ncbi:MAG: hypothetical protein E7100_02890 [Bacteroidaceae bacterium]|nr:hypothetical protein [Bacteroidaceae bacterium]